MLWQPCTQMQTTTRKPARPAAAESPQPRTTASGRSRSMP